MNMHNYVFGFFLLVTFPAAGFAAQDASQPGSSEQRAACDARCREDYQTNASALQACLRDCGAVGPAAPSSTPGTGDGTPVQATTVKSSKSNSAERQANLVTPPPVPAESSNLNLSKSNINREVEDEPSGAVEDSDGDR